jgi:hypothetical protein
MPAAATSNAMYVYGIVRAEDIPAVSAEGVAGRPVELVERGDLAALVSPLPPGELRVKRRDLHRHLKVLEEAFAETTIVPCPFGTVVQSEEDVDSLLLSGRRDELCAALETLDGRVQFNLKAVYEEEELLREIVRANPQIKRLRDEAADYRQQLQLGEAVAGLVEQRREADVARLVEQLSRLADDVVVAAGGAEDVALKASVLVPRTQVKRFDARLEELARREHPVIQLEVIGPLPPTAFAEAAAS